VSKIVEITRLRVRPERAHAFEANIADYARLLSAGEGCLGLQMGAVEGERLHYISEVTRRTVESHDLWHASEAGRELQARRRPERAALRYRHWEGLPVG